MTTLVTDDRELLGILELQRANLVSALPISNAQSDGFVTFVHTLEVLRLMHTAAPSIVAKSGDQVIAYALVMLIEARPEIPASEPMFRALEMLEWRGSRLVERSFYVMGQICIARPWRSTGVFEALYAAHDEHYAGRFECVVTAVATRNGRSLSAHARIGFETLHRYTDSSEEWAVLVRPLRRRPS